MNRNKYYIKALEEAKLYHPQSEGLSTDTPTSRVDTTVIKQNNIIILLLLQTLQKLEDIAEKPGPSKTKLDEDIEGLIQGIKKLEITKPVPRIPKQYTFGTIPKSSGKTKENDGK